MIQSSTLFRQEAARFNSELLALRPEVRELRDDMAARRRELARLKFSYEFAALRFKAALLRRINLLAKANFDPNQPRVPAGNPDGGQWTRIGGGSSAIGVWSPARARLADASSTVSSPVMSDANPEPIIPGAQYTQVQITIHPSALTGMSTIDDTTKKLTSTLAGIADTINLVPSLSPQAYGRIVHEAFALAVRLGKFRGIGFFDVETTYSLELNPRYGSKGSIRTDVVLRNDAGDIIAIYDVKTGGATIKPKRAAELRAKTRVGVNVPLIELHVLRGVTRKSAYLGIYCVRILRGRHQLTNW